MNRYYRVAVNAHDGRAEFHVEAEGPIQARSRADLAIQRIASGTSSIVDITEMRPETPMGATYYEYATVVVSGMDGVIRTSDPMSLAEAQHSLAKDRDVIGIVKRTIETIRSHWQATRTLG